MDILRAERMAQDAMSAGGDWDRSFILIGKSKLLECEWIDPFFGLFRIKGEDGFVRTSQVPAGMEAIVTTPEASE